MKLITWQISDTSGNTATIINFGARLINWQNQGADNNIIVGYANPEDYLQDGAYMGAIAGPFANRIGGASYEADGKTYVLDANEGDNHLHGGADGLEKVYWELVERNDDSLTLAHHHRPGDKQTGYPGNIDFVVTYKIEKENGLSIHLQASSEMTCPIGPTGHAYFNLGDHSQNINQHQLQLFASQFTPVNDKNIPTGDVMLITEAFDFQTPKPLEVSLDNNFVLEYVDLESPIAILSLEENHLALEVYTDYPGVQIYTADHMSTPFVSRNAVCIEPQYFPDSPNKPQFPFEFTTPEQPFNKRIRYKVNKL